MKFIMNRNVTIASTLGHSIAFEKNVPTFVPPAMHQEVVGKGAVPVDGEVQFDDMKSEVNNAPADGAERAEMIKMVLADMKERNVNEEFTAGGSPKVKVVSTQAGFEVTAAEVADLWNAMKAGE